MDTTHLISSPSSKRSAVWLLPLAGLAFVLAAGCSKSEAAPARATRESHEGAGSVQGGPKVDTENYTVEMKGAGSVKAGAADSVVEVTLTTKGAYHINKQYPYRFKLSDPAPEGVTFPKPLLQRADGTFEETKGSFKVPFVAAKPGKVTIAGTLSLSVCSDGNCLMDKQPLELTVDVQ